MSNIVDIDKLETQEWLDALAGVVDVDGTERATFLLQQLSEQATKLGIATGGSLNTAYLNSIAVEQQPEYPGDIELEKQISGLMRWNAIAMVLRAGKKTSELGGHIATYASASLLYEMGFHHFFKAHSETQRGDLIYYQGHASPGIYARAFLEGRLSEQQLDSFRQEVENDGLSSYPHPWLMPNFWEFPTVSMGLGPLQAIYQARFLRYMHNRQLTDTADRHVWAFLGDGEMDEPESLGAITLAGRENLDNLIFVINCNLQRLDGPVRGNGKIIQELESIFKGAGWDVIKVVWGSGWDKLLAKDTSGLLKKRMMEVVDGEYQVMRARDGAYIREHFFGKYPELLELVADMSDDDIFALRRGGHDPEKLYAAYQRATTFNGKPTVVLTKTVKGFGMGQSGEAQNTTHQQKKMAEDDLAQLCEKFSIPIAKNKIKDLPFYRPKENSKEMKYLRKQREALNGYLPARYPDVAKLPTPSLKDFAKHLESSGEREISTTMAFVRILTALLKDKALGKHIVPIVPDESRTFGMEGLFRQVGIYSSKGQLYKPEDAGQIMYYREATDGQILQEGINEPGAMCSWMAAATSYASNGVPMIPFYIYYSMFGPQRVGDLVWASGDMQAKGFLIGGTAGRTTLAGEGLQHQDGHSPILFSTVPNCLAYDPTFAYEVAVIIQNGLERMYKNDEKIFYYVTAMNENYHHPAMPKGAEEGIIKGMYLLQESQQKEALKVQLLGSGTILREVMAAAEILEKDYNVSANIWSATSFNELRREALAVERWNRFHPEDKPKKSYVAQLLEKQSGPVIAATDYMKAYADQIREFVPSDYVVLGTDGFGRSDTRKQLRHFFEVDSRYIVVATLKALADQGKFKASDVAKAMKKFKINPDKENPFLV